MSNLPDASAHVQHWKLNPIPCDIETSTPTKHNPLPHDLLLQLVSWPNYLLCLCCYASYRSRDRSCLNRCPSAWEIHSMESFYAINRHGVHWFIAIWIHSMSRSSLIHYHGFILCHGVHWFIVIWIHSMSWSSLIHCHMDSFYVMEFIDSLSYGFIPCHGVHWFIVIWIHSVSWSSLIHCHMDSFCVMEFIDSLSYGFILCHGVHWFIVIWIHFVSWSSLIHCHGFILCHGGHCKLWPDSSVHNVSLWHIRIKSGEPGFLGFSVPGRLGGVICKPEGVAWGLVKTPPSLRARKIQKSTIDRLYFISKMPKTLIN